MDDNMIISDDEVRELTEEEKERFTGYYQIAEISRKLWWLSLKEVEELIQSKDKMKFTAFILVAENTRTQFFRDLASCVGSDSAVLSFADEETKTMTEGQIANNKAIEEAKMKGLI